MRTTRWLAAAATPLALGALLTSAQAQGKGKGGGEGRGHQEHSAAARVPSQGGGKSEARSAQSHGGGKSEARSAQSRGAGTVESRPAQVRGESRGPRARASVTSEAGGLVMGSENRVRSHLRRTITIEDLGPVVRPFATSGRPAERFLGRAVGLGEMRGLSEDDLKLARAGNRVHVINGRGDVLLELDDEHARDIGAWRVATVDDRNKEGSPSFCRSGAGHPVWGRQWCLEKGFGLGMENDIRWGQVVSVGDIILRRPRDTGDLRRDVLSQVLGDIVFNRLAAHAITLGLTDPLTGRWIGETTGPRVLLVSSSDHPVAEVVDLNRDDQADMLLVALRPW